MIEEFLPYFKMDINGNILEANIPFKVIFNTSKNTNLKDICLDWNILKAFIEQKIGIEGIILRFSINRQKLYTKIFAKYIDNSILEGVIIDITESYKGKGSAFSKLLIEAQEEERKRISRELHDEVGQTLIAIKMNLEFLKRQKKIADSFLDESITLVEKTINQIRDLSLELRPSMLDDIGLISALKWYISRQKDRSGINISFDCDFSEENVSKELAVNIFRIVQEALTNIVRHSEAKNAYVEIKQRDKSLDIFINDDGKGFDLDKVEKELYKRKALGILGMKERVNLIGGEITIDSKLNVGTTIRVRFPLTSYEEC